MFDVIEIGRRISRLRKERDMTQPALADKMGVSAARSVRKRAARPLAMLLARRPLS